MILARALTVSPLTGLDDLCVRFIINLPPEELESVERICFQVEEAQWFYEDFIRPLDPSLPSLSLRAFSLRIFQHCPLFSQWSAQHHTTAFAEFLAYKSRVPVRGAIMLNEAMDEVVLVKGWKKGANWSFPRGKINKDENDLDCAVREVYEETGFDIRAAGLIKADNDVKYIEVTMREQHMRLYVFRGVPMDTHFEPRTRKEISKIEWYKLSDLPTLKKHRHQDSNGAETPTVNANKFYMVAPFLHPLKKWIAQQKKKENRYSSNLAAPPLVAEATMATTEDETDAVGGGSVGAISTRLFDMPAHALSDLPEVSMAANDPSSHLKELLNMGRAPPLPPPSMQAPSHHMQDVDMEKTNALLALLRGGPTGAARAIPHTPLEQTALPPESPRSPHQSHTRPAGLDLSQPPPPFPMQPELRQPVPRGVPTHPHLLQPPPASSARTSFGLGVSGLDLSTNPVSAARPLYTAPYQQTGDLQFSRPILAGGGQQQPPPPAIPPASALPKLTNHTKALLDVFKGGPAAPSLPKDPRAGPTTLGLSNASPGRAAFRLVEMPQNAVTPRSPPAGGKHLEAPEMEHAFFPAPPEQADTQGEGLESLGFGTTVRRPDRGQRKALLDLFTQPSTSKPSTTAAEATTALHSTTPAELAADAPGATSQQGDASKDKLLLALLRQGNHAPSPQASGSPRRARPAPREGETAATVSGPLHQPDFEAIARAPAQTTNGMGRSPLTTNRTLYNPNQPAPVKILSRSEEARQSSGRSARTTAKPSSSPRRGRKEKAAPKESAKPFQPQILRRPQTTETVEGNTETVEDKTETVEGKPGTLEGKAPPTLPITSSPSANEKAAATALTNSVSSVSPQSPVVEVTTRPHPAPDAHKQTLLSLFGGGPAVVTAPAGSAVVSPISTSQILSPGGEKQQQPVSAIEPISTRSRVGSLASVTSGPGPSRPPPLERRQTGAENRAFLLGYLGRMASREG